jgi:hypothetical protein
MPRLPTMNSAVEEGSYAVKAESPDRCVRSRLLQFWRQHTLLLTSLPDPQSSTRLQAIAARASAMARTTRPQILFTDI